MRDVRHYLTILTQCKWYWAFCCSFNDAINSDSGNTVNRLFLHNLHWICIFLYCATVNSDDGHDCWCQFLTIAVNRAVLLTFARESSHFLHRPICEINEQKSLRLLANQTQSKEAICNAQHKIGCNHDGNEFPSSRMQLL
jgi:hypothetical protein